MPIYDSHFRDDTGIDEHHLKGVKTENPLEAAKVMLALSYLSSGWTLNPVAFDTGLDPAINTFRAGNPHGGRANVRVTEPALIKTPAPAPTVLPTWEPTPDSKRPKKEPPIPPGFWLPTTDELNLYRDVADPLQQEIKFQLTDPANQEQYNKTKRVLECLMKEYGFL